MIPGHSKPLHPLFLRGQQQIQAADQLFVVGVYFQSLNVVIGSFVKVFAQVGDPACNISAVGFCELPCWSELCTGMTELLLLSPPLLEQEPKRAIEIKRMPKNRILP